MTEAANARNLSESFSLSDRKLFNTASILKSAGQSSNSLPVHTGSPMTADEPVNALVNPLATPEQLQASSSSLDGIPQSVENAARLAGACLTQAAGALLRLPQDVIARAIVIFTRFWVGAEGGSLRDLSAADISAASLYLIAKPSATPVSPRSIINTYAYLAAYPPTSPSSLPTTSFSPTTNTRPDPTSYYISEGTYALHRTRLHTHETLILRTLGFNTHVALPHSLCINYLQLLDILGPSSSTTNGTNPTNTTTQPPRPSPKTLATRALTHLNSALLSPQLLYLTHQPHILATSAIYLAAREVGYKLPEEEWWEVFDTEREELGFVVVGMLSLEGWVGEEVRRWGKGGGGGIWELVGVEGVRWAVEREREKERERERLDG